MYACYSYRFDHYGHLELQMTQWMPLALLALHLFVSTGRWPYALGLALAGVAQLYSSMYYAVFFLVYTTAIGAGLLIVNPQPVRRLVAPIALAVAVATLMSIPIALAFTAARPLKGERGTQEVTFYSATPPITFVRTGTALSGDIACRHRRRSERSSQAWRRWRWARLHWFRPLVRSGWCIRPGSSCPLTARWGLTAFSTPTSTSGLAPFAKFVLQRALPPSSASRSILAGFGARRALRWCPSRGYEQAIFATLIAFVMIDAWPALTLSPVWKAARDLPGAEIAWRDPRGNSRSLTAKSGICRSCISHCGTGRRW